MNERRALLWIAAGAAVSTAAFVELEQRRLITTPTSHVRSFSGSTYTHSQHTNLLFERATLRADAITACNSLTPEQQDHNVQNTTDLEDVNSFIRLRDELIFSRNDDDARLLVRQRQAILTGCLRIRNAPGDQGKADRITEIGVE